MTVIALSARRNALASLENAYAVAIQLRENTGIDQFVVGTDNPLQPFSPSASPGAGHNTRSIFWPWSLDQAVILSPWPSCWP